MKRGWRLFQGVWTLFFFASSGFGADFTQNSLLATFRPDRLHLPTTNGEHSTGGGINMGEAIGTFTIDLEWVQVHPTGLVMTGLKRTWDEEMSTGLMGGRPSLVSKLFVPPLVFFFSLAGSTAPRRSSRFYAIVADG